MSDVVTPHDTTHLSDQVGEPGASVAAETGQIPARIDSLLTQVGGENPSILEATTLAGRTRLISPR